MSGFQLSLVLIHLLSIVSIVETTSSVRCVRYHANIARATWVVQTPPLTQVPYSKIPPQAVPFPQSMSSGHKRKDISKKV